MKKYFRYNENGDASLDANQKNPLKFGLKTKE